jgi:hypothetical protein
MIKSRDNELRTVQRKMLRAILGRGRLQLHKEDENKLDDPDGSSGRSVPPDDDHSSSEDEKVGELVEDECLESWVEWKMRVTHEALDAMKKVGLADWVEQQRRRLWRWSGHGARRDDGRWTARLISWTPAVTRAQAHPIARWSDVLAGFCATLPGTEGLWTDWAQSREGWAMLEDDFIAFSM